MDVDVDNLVARALDASPELLPFLPELLADLDELSVPADTILDLIEYTDLKSGDRVVDLGCGKGAIGVALARRGFFVAGVDAMSEFIDDARRRAEDEGLDHLCAFWAGDLREVFDAGPVYDLAMLLGVGSLLGSLDEVVRDVRACIAPGRYMILDDAFLADPSNPVDGYEDHRATLDRLLAHGDELVTERLTPREETRRVNRRQLDAIRRRAEALARLRPHDAPLIMGYVQEQERQCALLEGPLQDATWLLRKR